jgi:hypothetical protein
MDIVYGEEWLSKQGLKSFLMIELKGDTLTSDSIKE